MDCLPSLSYGTSTLRLPLSAEVAELLTDLIATRDPLPLVDALRRGLRRDPAFALWTVCRQMLEPVPAGRTASELAEWLLARLTADFTSGMHVSLPPVAEATPYSPVRPLLWWSGPPRGQTLGVDRYQVLARESLAVARLAADAVGTDETTDPEEVFLAGLLHNAAAWIALCTSGSPWPPHLLPPQQHPAVMLATAEFAQRLAAESAADELDAEDAEEIDAEELDETTDVTVEEITHVAAEAATAGASLPPQVDLPNYATTPAGRRLPELAARLHRYTRLEREYQRSLEFEKLASLGELAAGAGHEINNPLAVISGRAQLLMRDEPVPERRQQLATVKAQALRVHEMISDLMLFARPPRPQPTELDMVHVARTVIDELATESQRREIVIRLVSDIETLPVEADPRHLAVALRALLENSLQAIGSQGEIELYVRSSMQPSPRGGKQRMAIVELRDNGPGISPEVRRHLFDPFYSGRSAGRGLGFGLTKCWRIVTLHGGSLDVHCGLGAGAKFIIRWPLKQPLGAAA